MRKTLTVYYVDGTWKVFNHIDYYKTENGFLKVVICKSWHNYETTIIPADKIQNVKIVEN